MAKPKVEYVDLPVLDEWIERHSSDAADWRQEAHLAVGHLIKKGEPFTLLDIDLPDARPLPRQLLACCAASSALKQSRNCVPFPASSPSTAHRGPDATAVLSGD